MSQKGFSKPRTRGFASVRGTILLLVVAVVVVAVAGILVWQQLQQPTEEEQSSGEETGMSQEETQPSTDETADWKTFKTDYFGFEIKYPADWFADVNLQNISTVEPNGWLPMGTLPKGQAKILFERSGRQSVDDFIAEHFGPTTNNLMVSDTIVNFFIGGTGREVVYACKDCKARYVQEIGESLAGQEGRVVFFFDGNDVLYFWLSYYKNDERVDYFINTFHKMLSTFRFLE